MRSQSTAGSCARPVVATAPNEVDYEGDAFFYAFSSAQDAVSAVSEAMAGLEEGPISIRVGIHTGEPALDPPSTWAWTCTSPLA